MADNIQIIRENGVTLEYTTMNNSVTIKQADIVLMTFPLDYTTNYDTKAALNDLDYVSRTEKITWRRLMANDE